MRPSRPGCASGGARSDARDRGCETLWVGPGDDLEVAVLVFDQRCAALHPIAAVQIANALLVADGGVMNMPADHAFSAVPTRFTGKRFLESADIVHGVLHLLLRP